MKAPVLGPRPYNALAIIHTQQSNTFDMLNSLTTSVVSKKYSIVKRYLDSKKNRFIHSKKREVSTSVLLYIFTLLMIKSRTVQLAKSFKRSLGHFLISILCDPKKNDL